MDIQTNIRGFDTQEAEPPDINSLASLDLFYIFVRELNINLQKYNDPVVTVSFIQIGDNVQNGVAIRPAAISNILDNTQKTFRFDILVENTQTKMITGFYELIKVTTIVAYEIKQIKSKLGGYNYELGFILRDFNQATLPLTFNKRT